MNPADLTLPTLSPTLTSKNLPTPQSSAQRNGSIGKAPIPRVDLEPIYTHLKSALGGEQWAEYKAAINAFVLGKINQAELSWVLAPLLSPAPSVLATAQGLAGTGFGDNFKKDAAGFPLVSTLQLHNTLVASLYANCARDAPPSEVAPWVVATDRPAIGNKAAGGGGGASGDKAEERLRKEVMSLGARDRRRIKGLKNEVEESESKAAVTGLEGLRESSAYHDALAVKAPSAADVAATAGSGPGSTGGVGRMNYEMESRRRYAQPLASETLEFPTLNEMHARIEPIAAEEGLAGSTQSTVQACAELVEQATEVYIKELLGQLRSHTKANGEGCIQTSAFRRQLQREEEDTERGVVQRNAAGFLPAEMDVLAKQEPLDMEDLRISMLNNDFFLKQDKFLAEEIWLDRYPEVGEHDDTFIANGGPVQNGDVAMFERAETEEASVADDAEHWQGATKAAHMELGGILDDCLAVG
ncbi:hypothetical protein D0863_02542 [Hortaea werneckii]|uniref:Transcriptional coactivator HFI1/ADA1 n=1 Tax=Hortaea werneckii TaxID=91943 RepID=A0A3M7EFW2_HORWE|nr:hypothetical protein D0863_02542 [Hortaea werneckii]